MTERQTKGSPKDSRAAIRSCKITWSRCCDHCSRMDCVSSIGSRVQMVSGSASMSSCLLHIRKPGSAAGGNGSCASNVGAGVAEYLAVVTSDVGNAMAWNMPREI